MRALAGAKMSQIGYKQSDQPCTDSASSTQVRDNVVQTQGQRQTATQSDEAGFQ